MVEQNGTLPAEMVPFVKTPVAEPFVRGRNIGLVSSTVLAAVLFVILQWVAFTPMLAGGLAGLTLVVNATVISLRYQSHASTPLAVNMNHPFVMDEPMGKAEVMVKMSSEHGVTQVHTVYGSYPTNCWEDSAWSKTPPITRSSATFLPKERTPTLVRHLALINQAIALRDAVNEVPDPIEGARNGKPWKPDFWSVLGSRSNRNWMLKAHWWRFSRAKNDSFWTKPPC